LSEFAEQRRMTECVRFLGGVAHDMLPVLYSGAMVFVFPTLYEGFGLPPLEAMASGTPVCLSRIPVLEEVAGDAAAYFNPEDIFDIADKLVSVLLDSERHKALREAGLERARRFSWRRAAEETLRVYREVLGQ
ncbi:MAG: glycosyltransferase family 4 protein, partial [Candidatus Coatesbacteria bacterium]|nr:glycosyltransferase family 4 protein [Candidatus Coatesbacteria bacterium]